MDGSLQRKPDMAMSGEKLRSISRKIICILLMLALCLSGTALAAARTLKYGQTGDDVKQLQTRLSELGYYTGTVSGKFDEATRTAVKLFQKANDLSVDGTVGSADQKKLIAVGCLTYQQYMDSLPLKKGDKGMAVVTLQQQLSKLGYYTGNISGIFDSATRDAVKLFQTANSIKASGTATKETRLLLNSGKGINLDQYNQIRTLKSGNKGAAVIILQNQLKKLGYYTDESDGIYDDAVKSAVKTFQTANGLKANGTADTSTRKLINSGKCVTAAAYYQVCALKSGNKGPAVVVLQQRLTVLEYYDGPLDGKYDTDIKNAVKSFQTANGIKATGTADVKTRAVMNSSNCVTGATYNLKCALKSGNSGVAVKVLQRQLAELGYYTGSIDGKYSSAVKSAVKTCQTANGLKANGTADTNTRKLITSGKAITNAQYDQVRPLKSGNSGAAVQLVQSQLKQLGFYTGNIDGKYTSAVKNAVKTLQTANNIKATGTADVATRTLLNSGKAVNAQQYDMVRPLSSGNKGEAVAMVQEQLARLGYFVEDINGKFDSATKSAVKIFQTANGIKATGKADVATRTLLNSGKGVNRAAYDANRTLKKGEVGSTVRSIQERLIALGYYAGIADGRFQSSTQKAIKLFQEVHGLKETGTADVNFRKLLFSSQAVNYAQYERMRPLKYGDKGEGVALLQTQLKELGYFKDSVDGRYRSSTQKAVKQFQLVNGFKQNGSSVTVEMRIMLNEGRAISAEHYNKTVALKKGDKGDPVKVLQSRLMELGYFMDSISGAYGSATASAVRLFQVANGLSATGEADSVTRVVMNSNNAVTKAQYDNSLGSTMTPERAEKIERLIAYAMAKMGCKYVHNTSGPNTFDCSGYTKYVFGQMGIELSGASWKQGYLDKYGEPYLMKLTSYDQLQRGDLLVFDTDKDDDDLSDHLGIYLGNGTFIHASSARGEVVISNLIPYGNFSWAFRLI